MINLKYHTIIIGAGVGGLTAAAKLASNGKKVLVLEKIHHIGGTSHVFRRGEFYFPMGPLSFSYPNFVNKMLREIGITEKITYSRSHFQLISPDVDIIYSKPLSELQKTLIKRFPEEKIGISRFFSILLELTNAIKDIYNWDPDYSISKTKSNAKKKLSELDKKKYDLVNKYSEVSSKEVLDEFINNSTVKKLLGSQGTYEPIMSMLHLAFMWNVMSEEGIWFPSCGIHGINELLYNSILSKGGEIKLNTPVREIIIEDIYSKGVITEDGTRYSSNYIISNADYKTTFLNLINNEKVPSEFYNAIKENSYTGSEICVYLGIEPNNIDLRKVRATHVFYRKKIENAKTRTNNKFREDFENKEIEICLWSEKSEEFVPKGKKSILLRVNFPYDIMEPWRTGVKRRKAGYKEFKNKLADKLINVVEDVLPGLSGSILKREIATPLTYQDWGKRYRGSIAGWSRDIRKVKAFDRKLLITTPIENLLMAGLYASKELFLGGYPISMYTGILAADYIS
ncbi:MAG: NAD(P)/FAD-dependent oxidoreductase [Promethearchaeota archaeon]|nr:MAG: NAD(P)/FAD-dependent oxidoreductase [Candidatus Lokiarchaeota archaeon]